MQLNGGYQWAENFDLTRALNACLWLSLIRRQLPIHLNCFNDNLILLCQLWLSTLRIYKHKISAFFLIYRKFYDHQVMKTASRYHFPKLSSPSNICMGSRTCTSADLCAFFCCSWVGWMIVRGRPWKNVLVGTHFGIRCRLWKSVLRYFYRNLDGRITEMLDAL